MRTLIAATLMALAGTTAALPLLAKSHSEQGDPAIKAAVADGRRGDANRARDKYRHPVETLTFFGVKPTQTIVEYSPGGGWYTQILAPMVNGKGKYIALTGASPRAQEGATKLMADNAGWFGKGTVAALDAAAGTSTVPAGTADVVLTFRNVHNLTMGGATNAANAFKAFYAALKPGGTLGVVEHRLPDSRDSAMEEKSGYLKRSTVLKLATDAGFRLASESEVNANPKDTADYPDGVWTLPPNLRKGDVDRAKYIAIGESDRMTLKFVKPS